MFLYPPWALLFFCFSKTQEDIKSIMFIEVLRGVQVVLQKITAKKSLPRVQMPSCPDEGRTQATGFTGSKGFRV